MSVDMLQSISIIILALAVIITNMTINLGR